MQTKAPSPGSLHLAGSASRFSCRSMALMPPKPYRVSLEGRKINVSEKSRYMQRNEPQEPQQSGYTCRNAARDQQSREPTFRRGIHITLCLSAVPMCQVGKQGDHEGRHRCVTEQIHGVTRCVRFTSNDITQLRRAADVNRECGTETPNRRWLQ